MPCSGCEDDDGWLYGGCSLEAKMKDGVDARSAGSGGSETKCRISAADVPMYRFPSKQAPPVSSAKQTG